MEVGTGLGIWWELLGGCSGVIPSEVAGAGGSWYLVFLVQLVGASRWWWPAVPREVVFVDPRQLLAAAGGISEGAGYLVGASRCAWSWFRQGAGCG